MYDLIIIGGGPAGTAAGVYAARKRLKTLFITDSFGGQSTDSLDIQNWIGTPSISGVDLGKAFRAHLDVYKDGTLEVREGETATSIEKDGDAFVVKTGGGKEEKSASVFVATGSSRRKLGVPGAEEFENKGISYCTSCDGPLFSGTDVVVVGGGNAAFESAAQLLAYSKSVTLLHHSKEYKADKITVEQVLKDPKMTALTEVEPMEIKGEKFVKSIVYEDKKTGDKKEINAGGIFIEIGLIPTTGFLEGLLEMTKYKQIVVDPNTQKTSVPGIWAGGDCTNVLYHQNNIAAGDAVKAIEDIYLFLKTRPKG